MHHIFCYVGEDLNVGVSCITLFNGLALDESAGIMFPSSSVYFENLKFLFIISRKLP